MPCPYEKSICITVCVKWYQSFRRNLSRLYMRAFWLSQAYRDKTDDLCVHRLGESSKLYFTWSRTAISRYMKALRLLN